MEQNTLIALIKCAITGERAPLAGEDWAQLIGLARWHRVEPLVQWALRERRDVPEEVRQQLEAAYSRAIFRDAQMDFTMAAVDTALKAANVPYLLLRGAVLKDDYPSPELRTMSDLDYLVHTEDYPVIKSCMEAIGGRHTHTDGGHFSFTLPPDVPVEFHPNLIYAASPVGTAVNPGWQYVRPDSGPYAQELTEEGFYLNMIAHLAYHFAKGGTGIRSILDVWVYRHRHRPQPDGAIVRAQLRRAGLDRFAERIEGLAECWFGAGSSTPELDRLGDDILACGAYGTEQRAVLSAACFHGGRWGAARHNALSPMEEMKNRYPWLNGRPYLLPAAWCIRAGRVLVQRRERLGRWTDTAWRITSPELDKQRAFFQMA